MIPGAFLLVSVGLSASCGEDVVDSGVDASSTVDASPTPDAPAIDLTELVFDPDRMLQVAIDMDPDDWDALRFQNRGLIDIFGDPCLAQPFSKPFTYFPGTVTIDGEPVPDTVGVRKKGFLGSLSAAKPSLKIKFSEYSPNQRYSGMKRMTFNNARQDPSYINQCIGYQLLADAGVPAPRCNFAHVTVNGQTLGIYAHVESIKKPFLRRHFDDDEGNLYEGTLSDFRPDWRDTFQRKTNESNPDQSDIDAILGAMEVEDSQLEAALEPLIDMDGFYTFWAMEVILGHWDGYAGNTNNFYMYRDPTTNRFHFIPWGIDALLRDQGGAANNGTHATGILARRLYTYQPARDIYVSRVQEMLDTVWSEAELDAELDRMEALLGPYLDPVRDVQFAQRLTEARDFISNRRTQMTTVFDPEPPTWQQPLRQPFCLEEVGTAATTFTTTWASIGQDPYSAGSGTMMIDAYGNSVDPPMVGAVVGPTQVPGETAFLMMGDIGGGINIFIYLTTGTAAVSTGAEISLNSTNAVLLYQDTNAGQDPTPIGYVGGGTLTFTQVDKTPGGTVTGTIDGLVYETF